MKRNPWIPFITLSLFILLLTSIPKIPTPPGNIRCLDKIAHFAIYFFWGFTLARWWNLNPARSTPFIILICTAPLLFPVLDELHQYLIPGRNPSVLDWICDVAGAALGFSIFAQWRRGDGA